jgi:hypothetical protein
MAFSRPFLLRSQEDMPVAPRVLRAGALSLDYAGGEVRNVRWNGIEAVRRIYGAVRDRNWGTIAPQVLAERVEQSSDGFRVAFEMRHDERDICFEWRGEIIGRSNNTLMFSFDGAALTSFERNRVGLCVLHPPHLAGRPARTTTPDASTCEAAFPTRIAPHQPFVNMAVLEHEIDADVWAKLDFEGEVFETEDQRNWSDASFKTYGTPLSLPFPVRIEAGEPVRQSISLTLPAASTSSATEEAPGPIVLRVGSQAVCTRPPLGLGLSNSEIGAREVELLRALSLAHVRADLRFENKSWPEALRRACRVARELGCALEMAVFPLEEAAAQAECERRVIQMLHELAPSVVRCIVLRPTSAPTLDQFMGVREMMARYDGTVEVGSGVDANFAELNRSDADWSQSDFVSFSSNPQVHAFDDASLFETLEVLPEMARSARDKTGRPVALSPLTLRPRFNAVQSDPAHLPAPGELPPSADPRQSSLLCSAWTVGALAALAPCALQSITLFETAGPRGVLDGGSEDPGGPRQVLVFPGAAFPIFHALADVGEHAQSEVLRVDSSAPHRAHALALRGVGKTRILVANFSPSMQEVALHIEGATGSALVRMLDEENAEPAAREPELFRRDAGREVALHSGSLTVSLRAYAVARVDVETESLMI